LDDDTAVACRRPPALPLPRADPTTPGSVTLPMIGTWYSPGFAGAVEAAACDGADAAPTAEARARTEAAGAARPSNASTPDRNTFRIATS
jgi:hypothetical protein